MGSPMLGESSGGSGSGEGHQPQTLLVSPALERVASSGGPGTTTPGSVSSIQVEIGSVSGEHPSEIGSTASGSRKGDSPLSSPIIDAVAIDLVVPPAFASPTLSSSPSQPLRGPLDSLRAPAAKFGSSSSLSSMAVETGSTIAPEEVSTPTAEEFTKPPPSAVGSMDEDEQEVLMSETEEEVREREERTQSELDRYEHETTDKVRSPQLEAQDVQVEPDAVPEDQTAALGDLPIDPAESPVAGRHSFAPPLPADEALPEAAAPLGLVDEAEDGAKTPEPPVFQQPPPPPSEEADVPMIKCGDCGASVSLMDLADHVCPSQNQSPALMSSPVISPQNRSPVASPARMSRSRSALSELSDLAAADKPKVNMAPVLSRSSSAKLGFSTPPAVPEALKFDQFVPQSEDVAPADMDEDLDEHYSSGVVPSPTVGAYPSDVPADDHDDSVDSAHVSGVPSHADLPQDMDDDDSFADQQDNSTFQAARQVLLDAGKRRASSANASPQPSRGVSRSASMYSNASATSAGSSTFGKTMPGGKAALYDSDEEDEGYEGGSVTIVRSTATHRVVS